MLGDINELGFYIMLNAKQMDLLLKNEAKKNENLITGLYFHA